MQVKVEQIRRKVDVLLSYADRFPPFSQDLYLVRQTASDYLPRTINAYLALPKQAAADKPVIPGGKTAYQELKAQLDLLDSKLDDIAQDLQRQDTDRLLANRRFLEERFGSREGQKPSSKGAPEQQARHSSRAGRPSPAARIASLACARCYPPVSRPRRAAISFRTSGQYWAARSSA